MDKTVPNLCVVDDDEAPKMPAELRVALADVADLAREGLLAMSVGVGLAVMVEMMESEVTAKVGPKNARVP
ncbi:MAG: IS256 family transposase, partial [Acidimicrobiales bacterium]